MPAAHERAAPFGSAIPISITGGQHQTGVISQTPTFYAFSVTDAGLLTAEVDPTGGAARLTLLSSDGQILMQSDGESPGNPNDLIDLHLTGAVAGTTYYLEVQGLGNSSRHVTPWSDQLRDHHAPFQPLARVGYAPVGRHAFDFNGDGKADLVVANFDDSATCPSYLGRGDGTFAPRTTLHRRWGNRLPSSRRISPATASSTWS